MTEQVARKLDVKQICYIDDSKTSAFVTKKLLKNHGFLVDHFSDAESALEALMEFDYALLITDLMISAEGGVNGDDLIRLIRQSGHPVKSHIPIVVVTGSSDVTTYDNLLHVGADRVLHKPLDGKILQKTIEELAPKMVEPESKTEPQKPILQPADTKEISIKQIASEQPPTEQISKLSITLDESDELKSLGEITAPELEQITQDISDDSLRQGKSENISVPVQTQARLDANQHLSADDLLGFSEKTLPVSSQKSKPAIPELKVPVIEEKEEESEIPTLTQTVVQEQSEDIQSPDHDAVQHNLENDFSEESISQLLDRMYDEHEAIETPAKTSKAPLQHKPETTQKPESLVQNETAQSKVEQAVTEKIPEPEKQQTTQKDFAQKSYETEKENPLLSLLDHLEEEEVTYDRDQPFKSTSIFASKGFKRIFWAVLLISLIAPAVTFWILGQSQTVVQTTTASRGNLSTEITVPGRVVSKRKINISARSAGQVVAVAVKEGDTVEKGVLLVQMDDKEALSNLNRIQAKLISIQETVAQTSKLQERLQKALDVGAVSRQQVEDAEAAWKTASAKQSVVEEELKAAKLQLERLKITAPFDGMITSVTVQEGQWVAPSAPLLNIVDMRQRMAEVRVDVSDSGNLSVGQAVTISSEAFPGQRWQETITKISSEASREDSANIIKVFASLDSSPSELRIGQQLDAQIQTAARSNTIQIPFNVLFTHQGRPHVAIIENSKLKFVPVILGIESISHVEVVEGLREGQEIVVPSGTPLKEGAKVVVAGSSVTQ